MDNFNKQTLRAAHQHLTTMSYQLHECRSVMAHFCYSILKMQGIPSASNLVCFGRIRQLDKFQFTLTEELEKFEKDSQSLKIMEKEFSVCILVVLLMSKREFFGICRSFTSSLI